MLYTAGRGGGGLPTARRASEYSNAAGWRAARYRGAPLTRCIYFIRMIHMRTTLILDDELLEKARALTGLTENTAVVHAGLRALIVQRSAQRLAALGGADRRARAPRRRRPEKPTK